MRRSLILMCCLVAGMAAVPARATTVTGFVRAPVVSPVPQRTLHNAGLTASNGSVGWVISLSPLVDGLPYTLTRTGSAGAVGHLDVYFFKAGPGGSIGDTCSVINSDDKSVFDSGFANDQVSDPVETGTICAGPDTVRWAIVVLRTGANATFSFTY